MHFFYAIILLLGATQLIQAKLLNYYSKVNASATPEEQFEDFYVRELSSALSPQICFKLKNITEALLKDATVQQAATPTMQKIKSNLTSFYEVFPVYGRFHLCEPLAAKFSQMFGDYYYQPEDNEDSTYILQLLNKLGYSDMRTIYKVRLQRLVSEKFSQKLQELRKAKPSDWEYNTDFQQWVNNLKTCPEYECYFADYEPRNLSAFSRIMQKIGVEILEWLVLGSYNATSFARRVLSDRKLTQLSTDLRQQLTKNLQDFIKIDENIDNVMYMGVLSIIFHSVIFKFNNYSDISLKDRQLIKTIFDEQGYKASCLYLNEILQREGGSDDDYVQQFENVKAMFIQEDVEKFFSLLDRLRQANTVQERNKVIEEISNINVRSRKPQ